MKKSWTSSGVLRITSTYQVAGSRIHATRDIRQSAPTVPTTKLRSSVRIEMCRVVRAPSRSMGSSRKISPNWKTYPCIDRLSPGQE
jgi:hypothetical protein